MATRNSEIIDTYLDRPVYKNLQQDGITYVFDRYAECDDDGWCSLGQLRPDEVMLTGGLIYRRPQAAA